MRTLNEIVADIADIVKNKKDQDLTALVEELEEKTKEIDGHSA